MQIDILIHLSLQGDKPCSDIDTISDKKIDTQGGVLVITPLCVIVSKCVLTPNNQCGETPQNVKRYWCSICNIVF